MGKIFFVNSYQFTRYTIIYHFSVVKYANYCNNPVPYKPVPYKPVPYKPDYYIHTHKALIAPYKAFYIHIGINYHIIIKVA